MNIKKKFRWKSRLKKLRRWMWWKMNRKKKIVTIHFNLATPKKRAKHRKTRKKAHPKNVKSQLRFSQRK